MTTEGAREKRCPKCSVKDLTDFASCRSCGTRYDAKPLSKKPKLHLIALYLIISYAPVGLLPILVPRPPQSDTTKWHTDLLTGKRYYVDLARGGRTGAMARNVEFAQDLTTDSTHTYWGWLAAQPGGQCDDLEQHEPDAQSFAQQEFGNENMANCRITHQTRMTALLIAPLSPLEPTSEPRIYTRRRIAPPEDPPSNDTIKKTYRR